MTDSQVHKSPVFTGSRCRGLISRSMKRPLQGAGMNKRAESAQGMSGLQQGRIATVSHVIGPWELADVHLADGTAFEVGLQRKARALHFRPFGGVFIGCDGVAMAFQEVAQ